MFHKQHMYSWQDPTGSLRLRDHKQTQRLSPYSQRRLLGWLEVPRYLHPSTWSSFLWFAHPETTFDHWKVVFSWVKVRKRAPTQNPPYLLILIFWILNLHIIMCQFHESHSMFLPLVCNKLVKSPTPFFPFLSIARSPKLIYYFGFRQM